MSIFRFLFRRFKVVRFRPFFLTLCFGFTSVSDHQNRRAAARLVLVSIANGLRTYLIAISSFILLLLVSQVLPCLCFLCSLLILSVNLIFGLHNVHRQHITVALRWIDRIANLLCSAHKVILVILPCIQICH